MIERIGVHESVSDLFPPTVLRDELADVPADVVVAASRDDLSACDALVTFAYEDTFLESGLRWIHSVQSGVDRFPFDELDARGIRLTNSEGIHGDVVGETVTGYMLMFARHLHEHRANQVRGEWSFPEWDAPFSLRGESLCVVGLGTLGRGIAARADALGMDVCGVKRTPTPVDHVDTVYPSGELQTALSEASFVALAVPLTDRTEGMIGEEELATMRDDAHLINVARGPVVDQSALVSALEADGLAGAALDVFEEEPLPEESPLWEMENVIVTPHAAAITRDYYRRVAAIVCENVHRFAANDELANGVV